MRAIHVDRTASLVTAMLAGACGAQAVICDPACADANGDFAVNLVDLNIVLSGFGAGDAASDVTCDGVVDVADVNLVLAQWNGSCAPLIGPDEAQLVVLEQVVAPDPEGDLLVGYAFPTVIGTGTVVEPWRVEDGPSMVAAAPSWLFYLERGTAAKCERAGRYCLVSGSADAPLVEVTDQFWPPVVEGSVLYQTPEEYTVSPDRFLGAYPEPTCPQTVEAPATAPPPALGAEEKMWSIAFVGPGMWRKDVREFDKAANQAGGVPVDNGKLYSFNELGLAAAIEEANEANASCVYVYVSSHTLRGSKNLDSVSRDESISAAELADALDDLKACSVYVLIDACTAGDNYITPITNALMNRDADDLIAHDPPTVGVFTSSSRSKNSNMDRGGACAMSAWTRELVKCWKDADSDGDDEGDDVSIFEAFECVLESECASALRGDPQSGGFSYTSCGGAIQAIYRGGEGWWPVDE